MGQTVTLKTIAERAGVSIRTVSLALQGTGRIGADTRERIIALAKELEYRPNVLARGLVRSRTYLVGVVFPYIGISFFGQIIGGIEAAGGDAGYDLLLGDSSLGDLASPVNDFGNESRAIRRMLDRHVDGLVSFPDPRHYGRYHELEEAGIRFVHVMRKVPGLSVPTVTVDNIAGGKAAALHLLDLGHRRIGFLGSTDPFYAEVADRREGYLRAHLERGIGLDLGKHEEGSDLSFTGGKSAMRRLLGRVPDLTAVFAATDYAAVGAISALHEAGKRVPEDVSVVGYDDLELASCQTGPALSTVAQPKGEVGREAFRLLHCLVEGQAAESVVLQPRLIARGTSGLPPA